jgi:uncharacterized protein (TIGR00725 family)
MEAAARGAQEAGGLTIGILTDDHDRNANKYLDIVLPSGMGVGRNYLTALAADVMIAVPGGTGTLEEMCYAHDFGKPLLSWNSWTVLPDVPFVSQMDDYPTVRKWLQTQWLLLHAPKPQGEIR